MLREMVDAGVTHVVMEVSSHAIDLKRIYGCEYDLGVFTNLSREHLDYHRTMEEYFLVKKRFFEDVICGRPAVVNVDDPWGARLHGEVPSPAVTFGVDGPRDVSAVDVVLSIEGIDARIRGIGGEFTISSPLAGRFNLSNILAATAAALSLGIPQGHVRSGIGALDVVPGRLERVSKPGEPMVFVDYAHTGDAMEKVLETLSEFRKRRIITVFGCGGDRDRTKRPGMGRIAAALSDLVIITSDNPRTEDPLGIIDKIEGGIGTGSPRYVPEDITGGFMGKGYTIVADRREAIGLAVSVADDSDIVLVAGKGHEDYQIVGGQRFPFDDRVVVREALSTRRAGEVC
jgi:UDP-N-acetylmuramoyl-L-alanyl-D-glutamate--2,6-diaminopimelate ligase